MALIGRPPILILDEPFTGLDPDGAQLVRDVVMRERSRGTTTLFSSHILGQVETLCDEIGIISQGTLVAEGSMAGLQKKGELLTHTTFKIQDQTDDAIDLLDSLEIVENVSNTGSTIVVDHDSESSHLDLVRQLQKNEIKITDATIQTPTVEDIYREFT
ncbi:ABC-type multidrug transport system, ATPase component [Haloferax mucosum ATCC BAA-1512]|uniref:ABC-type multidrug transport system, ATPase component n=2 Tax=Haloferax mucosum TaxID=403181 RepID=M0IIH5_9EURY|nr:ABC-type multidrug transport system, ATPase component [Haloferax mucosum ATCC BAA-1512]